MLKLNLIKILITLLLILPSIAYANQYTIPASQMTVVSNDGACSKTTLFDRPVIECDINDGTGEIYIVAPFPYIYNMVQYDTGKSKPPNVNLEFRVGAQNGVKTTPIYISAYYIINATNGIYSSQCIDSIISTRAHAMFGDNEIYNPANLNLYCIDGTNCVSDVSCAGKNPAYCLSSSERFDIKPTYRIWPECSATSSTLEQGDQAAVILVFDVSQTTFTNQIWIENVHIISKKNY